MSFYFLLRFPAPSSFVLRYEGANTLTALVHISMAVIYAEMLPWAANVSQKAQLPINALILSCKLAPLLLAAVDLVVGPRLWQCFIGGRPWRRCGRGLPTDPPTDPTNGGGGERLGGRLSSGSPIALAARNMITNITESDLSRELKLRLRREQALVEVTDEVVRVARQAAARASSTGQLGLTSATTLAGLVDTFRTNVEDAVKALCEYPYELKVRDYAVCVCVCVCV